MIFSDSFENKCFTLLSWHKVANSGEVKQVKVTV